MSRPPSVTTGDARTRHTPPKLDELKRKKRQLAMRLDILTSELSALERRRNDSASASLNGGGSRAEREYDRLVEQLAEKANERTRLQHAITSLDVQLAEERARLEVEEQKRKHEAKAAHREKCIRFAMRIRKDSLEHRLPGASTEERAEIELQLAHLREIAEIDIDDAAAMEEWSKPKPCQMDANGRPILSTEPPPKMTPMVILYGLRPRPVDLGKK